ncbi:MAG: hypothetical protein NUV53_01815 [Patescibacteria group bacterium]|nr:hypothetical protein [Patescibacteria group bacterium]
MLRIQRALNTGTETLHKPEQKVGEGEKPLRVITSPALMGLYSLMAELSQEARLAIPKKMPRRASERMAVHEKLEDIHQQIAKVGGLFWDSVRDSLGEHSDDVASIGIREEWQIVACADEDNPRMKNTSVRNMVDSLTERLRESCFAVITGPGKEEMCVVHGGIGLE